MRTFGRRRPNGTGEAPVLPADAAHGAFGLDEIFLADVMARLFLGDDAAELGDECSVGRAVSEERL